MRLTSLVFYSNLTYIAGLDIKYGLRRVTHKEIQRATRDLSFLNLQWIEKVADAGGRLDVFSIINRII